MQTAVQNILENKCNIWSSANNYSVAASAIAHYVGGENKKTDDTTLQSKVWQL